MNVKTGRIFGQYMANLNMNTKSGWSPVYFSILQPTRGEGVNQSTIPSGKILGWDMTDLNINREIGVVASILGGFVVYM